MTAIELRPGKDRGTTRAPWLDSRHSFSFAHWHEPARMGHGTLRVLNEDRIAPASGFGAHPHRDMEIVTWVLAGTLEHRDSEGSHGVLQPGVVQAMSAGTGIVHSEVNPSPDDELHLLQIWLLPDRRGHAPRYEERALEPGPEWRVLASREPGDGGIGIHSDARIRIARLAPGGSVPVPAAASGAPYLHVAQGDLRLGDVRLEAGDAAVLHEPAPVATSEHGAALLLFDV